MPYARGGSLVVLLTGANGQLGTDFKKFFDREKIEYIATDYEELDITKPEEIEKFLVGKNIDIIINCAAYNNVDKAEEEVEMCILLNKKAPKYLAEAAKKIGAEYVTYSTDFVFDGEKDTPYTEENIPNPLSIYSKTKYEGERGVLDTYDKVFVIRTSWVFGIGNNNFNKAVISWSKTRDELSIVDDQISAPTYSKDLAEFSWKLIKTGEYGLYHLSNSGECSKYDQAKYVLESIGWKGRLNTAKTEDFNLKAKRAKYSKISSEKAEEIIHTHRVDTEGGACIIPKEEMPHWKNAIDRFLKELGY